MSFENNKLLIPVFIEKYLTPAGTFIYRQLEQTKKEFEKIVLTSSKTENVDKFPFDKIYGKKKNILELYIIKFYEKALRDRIVFNYHKILSPTQFKYFENMLNRENIRFVHAHYGTGGLEIYPVVKKLNKKLLVSFHGYDAARLLKLRSYIFQMKRIFPEIHVIVPSEYMKNKLIDFLGEPKKFHVIYYGIPVEFYKFVQKEPVWEKFSKGKKIRFLQVSNFVEKKGHEFTILAFSSLFKKYDNLELIFGGEGELYGKCVKLVKNLNLQDRIKFLGALNQTQVKEEMENADAFVHHSVTANDGDQEGIPNVIMEAMATGLPVISTEHAGIPELISDGVNGYLVSERNIEQYAIKLEQVLTEKNESLCLNARRTIEEKFNLRKQLGKLDDVYLELSKN